MPSVRAWTFVALLATTPTRAQAQAQAVTVAAAGDVLWGRYRQSREAYSPVPRAADPFGEVKSILQAADLAFANLESPVMPEPGRFYVYQSLTFRADPDKLDLMKEAGFDLLSLANNHMFNMGWTAPAQSTEICASRGLVCAGAGATWVEALTPRLVQVAGVRVAFFAYTWIMNAGRATNRKGPGAVAYFEKPHAFVDAATSGIAAARRYLGADFVIVSVHWGTEYAPRPAPSQRQAARALIRAGADLVLGHHPHVVQEVERYQNGLIAYSMGNFMFDNPALDQCETFVLVASLVMPGPVRHVTRAELEPVLIDRRQHVPKLARGQAGKVWRRRLANLAKGILVRPEAQLRSEAQP